jgi:hypothetical protein
VADIQRQSARPPVIVVFSDHGFRSDSSIPDEMFRSLFLASTPGHPGLFPDDTTPINMLPRLLNTYAGTSLPMATEESYWTDILSIRRDGLLNLRRWEP